MSATPLLVISLETVLMTQARGFCIHDCIQSAAVSVIQNKETRVEHYERKYLRHVVSFQNLWEIPRPLNSPPHRYSLEDRVPLYQTHEFL